jgi:hypothetical protein
MDCKVNSPLCKIDSSVLLILWEVTDPWLGALRAMTGTVPFEEALAARLSLIKPSLSQVEECLEKRPPR